MSIHEQRETRKALQTWGEMVCRGLCTAITVYADLRLFLNCGSRGHGFESHPRYQACQAPATDYAKRRCGGFCVLVRHAPMPPSPGPTPKPRQLLSLGLVLKYGAGQLVRSIGMSYAPEKRRERSILRIDFSESSPTYRRPALPSPPGWSRGRPIGAARGAGRRISNSQALQACREFCGCRRRVGARWCGIA